MSNSSHSLMGKIGAVRAKKIITDEVLLSRKSVNVDPAEKRVLKIIDEMIATAKANEKNCASLAANQIGHLVRILVIKLEGRWYPIINPEIIARSPERAKGREGCLSRPGKIGIKVKRNKHIVLRYIIFNEKGEPEPMQDKVQGFHAIAVQHAMDHFEGVLI